MREMLALNHSVSSRQSVNMWSVLLVFCLPLAVGRLSGPVDLSHYYDASTITWPGGTQFRFTTITTAANDSGDSWYAVNDFETAEHGGTHLDAPYHFNRNGWKLGDIPLHRFFGKAALLDLRAKAAADPDYLVTDLDFKEWEEQHGTIPQGAIVLLDFGWTVKYNNITEYFGTVTINDTTSFHFPGLSGQGAQWLVETGRVYGVGTDTASIDNGQTKDYIAHKLLSQHNIFNLEHVDLPRTPLPATGYQILAMPMKIRQGTGAPCRVVAVPFTYTRPQHTDL